MKVTQELVDRLRKYNADNQCDGVSLSGPKTDFFVSVEEDNSLIVVDDYGNIPIYDFDEEIELDFDSGDTTQEFIDLLKKHGFIG